MEISWIFEFLLHLAANLGTDPAETATDLSLVSR
jgi:hypothetical protein